MCINLNPGWVRNKKTEGSPKMNLHVAQCLLRRDRMDWRKPHLNWISDRFYRYFMTSRG